MSHLGRWLSAQIDGELDGMERDRVLNHLAGCESCRREANALRALKRRMTALGDSASDGAIAGRLIERARSEPDLPPWLSPPRGPSHSGQLHHQVKPGWRIATGSAGTVLIAIGVLAFMLGGGQASHPMPRVSPAVDSYWMQHSYDTGQKPASGAVMIQSLLPTSHGSVSHARKASPSAIGAAARTHHGAR